MKLTKALTPLILVSCLLFSDQLLAQTYSIPSQELVDNYLENLKDCKNAMESFDQHVKDMENNLEKYTLKEYNEGKQYSKNNKRCIEILRRRLDTLRKDYPGWFNSPSTIIPIEHGHDSKPIELEIELAAMERLLTAVMDRFKNLEIPK